MPCKLARRLDCVSKLAHSCACEGATQPGGSPRQADRSPAWNRRLLRRSNTGWEVAGGERPVRNHVPCLTGHTVNPIRPRRSASLPVLCQRAPMQNVFCMGTQARAMTHGGGCPSACGLGSLACGHQQTGSVNGRKCWGWGGEVGGDGGVGRVDEISRETRQGQNGVHGLQARRAGRRESERP